MTTANPTTPGLDYFLPYQQRWLNTADALVLGEKSRRIGWTYVSSFRAVERRVRGGCSLYFSSADLTAAKEFIDYCKTWCHVFNAAATYSEAQEVIDDAEITQLVLTFANGRKIVAGSSNPKFFRSKGGDADGDEFAFHREPRELLKAMHATALFWGYQLRLWSTHNGEGNFFNQLVKQAKTFEQHLAAGGDPKAFAGLRARVQTVTVVDAVEQGLVEKIKNLKARDDRARREWLDELRSTCPDEDTWNEEYMCKPSSDQSSLLTYAMIQACEEQNLPVVEDLAKLRTSGTLYAGCDVGRKHDLTSLWVDEVIGDVAWNRLLKRMKDMPFSVQLDVLTLLMRNPAVKRLCIDATGLGMMLAEVMQQRFGKHRVEAVTFTPAVKSEIAMPLVGRFQDRKARIPAEGRLRESLHAVRKIVTAANNVRLDADRDDATGHADDFWAAALACHASDPLKVPMPRPKAFKPAGW